MAIYAFVGKQGAGKSYLMIREALKRAQKQRKFIVTNQPLNLEYLAEWARKRRKHWLHYIATNGGIKIVPNDANMLKEILSYRNSVIMLDEAQVFLNRRFTTEVPKQFLIDIAQQRKIANDLLWCAQDYDRVDQNIRSMTQLVFEAYRFETIIIAPGYFDRTYERVRAGARIPIMKAVADLRTAWVTPEFGNIYDTLVRLENAGNRGLSVLESTRPFEIDETTKERQLLEAFMSREDALAKYFPELAACQGGGAALAPPHLGRPGPVTFDMPGPSLSPILD